MLRAVPGEQAAEQEVVLLPLRWAIVVVRKLLPTLAVAPEVVERRPQVALVLWLVVRVRMLEQQVGPVSPRKAEAGAGVLHCMA